MFKNFLLSIVFNPEHGWVHLGKNVCFLFKLLFHWEKVLTFPYSGRRETLSYHDRGTVVCQGPCLPCHWQDLNFVLEVVEL